MENLELSVEVLDRDYHIDSFENEENEVPHLFVRVPNSFGISKLI